MRRGAAAQVKLHYPMYAEQNSLSCLKRRTCMPLGGYSVWATLPPAVLPASSPAPAGAVRR